MGGATGLTGFVKVEPQPTVDDVTKVRLSYRVDFVGQVAFIEGLGPLPGGEFHFANDALFVSEERP